MPASKGSPVQSPESREFGFPSCIGKGWPQGHGCGETARASISPSCTHRDLTNLKTLTILSSSASA